MFWKERIQIDPSILVGKPVSKGTRLAVEFVIDLLAQGWTEAQILQSYPGIAHEDMQACLAYASATLLQNGSTHFRFDSCVFLPMKTCRERSSRVSELKDTILSGYE
jgi:uncharacterized protein (DUF433 family)